MSESLKHLAMRIRNELPEIEHTLKRATEGMKRAKHTGDDYYLDGVALNLHSFYSGIERIFELIAPMSMICSQKEKTGTRSY